MSNASNIRATRNFLTAQLEQMQAEMDQLAIGTTGQEFDDPKVVGINSQKSTENAPVEDTLIDAAIVTGSFSFRPMTQVRKRLTLDELDQSIDELKNVCERLGVELVVDNVKSVSLSA